MGTGVLIWCPKEEKWVVLLVHCLLLIEAFNRSWSAQTVPPCTLKNKGECLVSALKEELSRFVEEIGKQNIIMSRR